MLYSELYEIMVNKVTFIGFRGPNRPNRDLLDELKSQMSQRGSELFGARFQPCFANFQSKSTLDPVPT